VADRARRDGVLVYRDPPPTFVHACNTAAPRKPRLASHARPERFASSADAISAASVQQSAPTTKKCGRRRKPVRVTLSLLWGDLLPGFSQSLPPAGGIELAILQSGFSFNL
jgi:hypothetical protein